MKSQLIWSMFCAGLLLPATVSCDSDRLESIATVSARDAAAWNAGDTRAPDLLIDAGGSWQPDALPADVVHQTADSNSPPHPHACDSARDCAPRERCDMEAGICVNACGARDDHMSLIGHVVGIIDETVEVEGRYYDPSSPGPHDVGVRFIDVWDSERRAPIEVTIWYPAKTSQRAPVWDYALGVEGADVAATRLWPVVLFSHGNIGVPQATVFLADQLASHGYIVVAPAHRQDTLDDYDESRFVATTIHRTRDLSLILDALELATRDRQDFFYRKIDTSRVGAIGHAWGAITIELLAGWIMSQAPGGFAAEVLARGFDWPLSVVDPRIDVGISLATCHADLFGTDEFGHVEIPMLYIGGAADSAHCVAADHAVPKARATPEGRAIVVENATHYAFTNMCEIDPDHAYLYQCHNPPRPFEHVQSVVSDVVTDYLGIHLRNDPCYGDYLKSDSF